MTWQVRRKKPEHFDNYVMWPEEWVATAEDYKQATVECESRYYGEEHAQMYLTDLPRKSFKKLYERTEALITESNEWWGLDIDGWEQPLRFNEYERGIGFPEHSDHNARDGSKLSLIQLMNLDFHGGALYIADELIEIQPGDVVVFPAFMPHRVEPITAGERISFSAWATGPRFV